MFRSVHPFPARMAPELALEKLGQLSDSRVVLDPMSGSGTVLRQAAELGHHAIGFDMDPLAVLMARVWTTNVVDDLICGIADETVSRAKALGPENVIVPWWDKETKDFADYWFAPEQQRDLKRLAVVLYELAGEKRESAEIDLLKVALSRIIITKDKGASLARDVSHSRPHKVVETSDFDVFSGFEKSVRAVRQRLADAPPKGNVSVDRGDARCLVKVKDGSVDLVLTSPPYLNAIDYLRGHRLSLIWLGHQLRELREIRSNSIGAERAAGDKELSENLRLIKVSMGEIQRLPTRFGRMIDRYAGDIYRMVAEANRVLKKGGQSTFVVGNSCLRGVFIKNSEAVVTAARQVGFELVANDERKLPDRHRYLPFPNDGSLGKRMRTETILSFVRS